MYSCLWKSIAQLWSVTCHMGSHSVTFHPTQVSTPRINPSHTGRYSIYLPQQDQCQASAAVVTLAANSRAHQTQSCHSDVQGSPVVIAAVSELTAE